MLVGAMVSELEIDFTLVMISVIHEWDFKTYTIYPFAFLVFSICREDGVSILHCDILHSPTRTVDIGLIKDEANVVAPRRGRRVKMNLLSGNLADTIKLSQGTDPATLEPADTRLADSAHATSPAPNAYQSIPHRQHWSPQHGSRSWRLRCPLCSTICYLAY